MKRIAIGENDRLIVTLDREDDYTHYTVRIQGKTGPENDDIRTRDNFTWSCVDFFRTCRENEIIPVKL